MTEIAFEAIPVMGRGVWVFRFHFRCFLYKFKRVMARETLLRFNY